MSATRRASTPRVGWLDLGPGWLFEHIRDAVAVVELPSHVIRLWNPAAERLFGYSCDDILGRPIDEVVPNAPIAFEATPTELIARSAIEEPFPIELIASPLDSIDGPAQFALLVMRDISDRRQAEATAREIVQRRKTERALLEAEDRLQRALARQSFLDEASRELAGSLDFETTLQTMARLAIPRLADACVVFALDEQLLVEAVASRHVDPENELRLDERAGDVIGQRLVWAGSLEQPLLIARDWPNELLPLRLKSGITVPLLARDHVLGLLVLASDADRAWSAEDVLEAEDLARRCALALDNARLYRTAEQAITARDQFLSIAAHELRAPLARLKSHAEVLLMAHQQDQLDDERLAWSVERINASVDRLAALTKDVLDLSRLRGGQFPFRPQSIDLAALVRDLEPRLAEMLGRDQELVTELTNEPTQVVVDQDRVEQLLSNLFDNAAKYSPRGGTVRLRVQPAQEGVLLTVCDEGVGLPAGSNEVIFEAFGRADNAEQWNSSGLGLGLHICRVIVERHGGRIWAESDGEHQGTTMSVWLPYAEQSPMRAGDLKERLANQLTLAVGYCELLANSPELPPRFARAGARGDGRRARRRCHARDSLNPGCVRDAAQQVAQEQRVAIALAGVTAGGVPGAAAVKGVSPGDGVIAHGAA